MAVPWCPYLWMLYFNIIDIINIYIVSRYSFFKKEGDCTSVYQYNQLYGITLNRKWFERSK